MTQLRWQLPASPLRASVVRSQLGACAALVGCAWAVRAGLQLSAVYPLKAISVFAAMMVVAIGLVNDRHPFPRFGAANQITTARATLVALVASLIGETASRAAAAAAVGASLTVTLLDGVDGWLARRGGMASGFGARFDMEIDALLIMVLAVLAWRYGKAGFWVMASGLLRYFFAGAGMAFRWLSRPLPPSRFRQTICVVQVVGLILVLVPAVRPPLSGTIAAVALLLLLYSFLVDTLWLWRHRATP
jgi:phosphatidylglycerophosphate synthase